MGNILGEPFKEYVDKQIKKRQEIHGKVNRTTEEISYLNSTNAWVKLASGVSLTQERLNLLKNEYGNPLVTTTNPGKELAMKNVLFNGVTSMGGTNLVNTPEEDLNEKEYFKQQQRTDFLGPNGAYGMGGNDFGIVPMPGIVSMDSQDLNRGSIKKTRVKLKAYNKNQFDILDVLYLRLGYTVLLEFGNNRYWDSGDEIKQGTNTLTSMGPTLIDKEFFQIDDNYYDLLNKIELKRKEKRGNYDAILGKIQNFSWTFAPDGTYDIDLDIISIGDVIESLKVNLPAVGYYSNDYLTYKSLRNQFRNNAATNVEDFYKIYPDFEKRLRNWWDKSISGEELTTTYTLPEKTSGVNEYLTDRESDGTEKENRGSLSITGTGVSQEEDVLAKDNIDKYKNRAIKFAIITMFQGIYGGTKEMQKNSANEFRFPESEFVDTPFTIDKIEGQKRRVGNRRFGDNVRFMGGIFNNNRSTKNNLNQRIYGSSFDVYSIFDDEYNYYAADNFNAKLYEFKKYAFTSEIESEIYDGPNPSGVKLDRKLFQSSNFESDYDQIRAQKVLFNNLYGGFDVFEKLVFTFFQYANAAGGREDNQFKDNPEFASFSQELEYEKNKNRIYEWFYLIRKYYTGITQQTAEFYPGSLQQQDPGTTYGTINIDQKVVLPNITNPVFEKRQIGFVLNPYEAATKNLDPDITDPLSPSRAASLTNDYRKKILKDWNEKVGFPKYTNQYANIDLIVLDKIGTNQFNLEPRFKFFVRLKTLLEFVQEKIVPQIVPSSPNLKVPLIKFDTDSSSNICYAIDNMVSSDIRSCIIRNDNVYAGSGISRLFAGNPGIDNFFSPEPVSGYIYGRPMNVYMNFEFIQNTLDTIVGNTGEAVLFDFLKKICNEINKCLGYVNNLEPVIDNETNIIKIIDQTSIPGIEEIAAVLKDDFGRKVYPNFKPNSPAVLEMYGYNPSNGQSNFVHNIGLTTGISKRYAAMITIGATANGSTPGYEATAFSKWNLGVEDRIKPKIIDPDETEEETLEQQNASVIRNYIDTFENSNPDYFYRLINLTKNGELEPIYLENNGPAIENFYKYAQAQSSQTGSLESSVGFLPFNLQIDMEGLSGIKIYNRVHVNTRFLPSNYPQTLDFIVTKVNHKLANNKWDTTLETQATRILKKDNEGNIINTPKLLKGDIAQSAILSNIKESQAIISNNTTKSKIIDNNTINDTIPLYSTYKNEISAQQASKQLHSSFRDKFLTFFEEILKIDGYEYIITSTFRTLERSQYFRDKLGSVQPIPGRSNHNYAASLDMQVKRISDGRIFSKSTPAKEWRRELPELMRIYKQLGMKWGGTFKGYNDPIHFSFRFNMVKTFENYNNYVERVVKQYGSPNQQGLNLKRKLTQKQFGEIDELLNRAGGDTGSLIRNKNQGPNFVGEIIAVLENVKIVL